MLTKATPWNNVDKIKMDFLVHSMKISLVHSNVLLNIKLAFSSGGIVFIALFTSFNFSAVFCVLNRWTATCQVPMY